MTFMLLEKHDKPNSRSQEPFVALDSSQNIYQAWGSYLPSSAYQWARETNARNLAADIYFTEFNRLFNHYYFRALQQKTKRSSAASASNRFLHEDDAWLDAYRPGSLRQKRVDLYASMSGAKTLE